MYIPRTYRLRKQIKTILAELSINNSYTIKYDGTGKLKKTEENKRIRTVHLRVSGSSPERGA
jgi:hypothetical protein